MDNTLKFLFSFFILASAASCEALVPDFRQGELRLRFSEDSYFSTRAECDIPDTNDFLLTVSDSRGRVVYQGKYGDSPESLLMQDGDYVVSVVSSEFTAPRFSAPQYGDSQTVHVSSGSSVSVELLCRQTNSGVRLKVASEFQTSYPKASLFLKNDEGKLQYSYSEKRIAYFNPGRVSLFLSDEGEDKCLLTRTLERREMLLLNISAPKSPAKGAISVSVDTSRVWSEESYVIGQGTADGSDKASALSVAAARANVGAKGVWVFGYIVGGDLSSSKASFSPPFKSRTNIVLAARSSTTEKSSCLSVQLQKGDIRDALNLVDNPDIIGKEIFLKGDVIESYYGIPGIRNITEFEFK